MEHWGRLGVFDLETTGVDVDTARIVSACVAVLDPAGDVIARWDWLADPGVEIPDAAAAVHGITTERARAEGRPPALVVAEIASTLRVLFDTGVPVVVYNAPYDLSLLDRECRRHEVMSIEVPFPVIDPLVVDKAVDRYRKGKRTLEVTAERYGVTLEGAHDAGADAIAAGRVALAIARSFPEELDLDPAELHRRQQIWYAEQSASFQEYMRRVKGDETFVANADWPVRPAVAPNSYQDTQPLPPLPPRPSVTVSAIDIYAPTLPALEGLEPATPVSLYDSAPPPAPAKRPTVLRVAAGIVTDPAGRTLLVRKRGSSVFMQAGGKIEVGESALEALSRELREEIGLEIDLDSTEYLGSFRAVAANEPDTVIRAEVFALAIGFETYRAGAEIEELLWLESVDAGVELAPLTRDTILPLWVERRSALF
jgi:DNA polymerase-3 subunit epsilon